MIKTHFHLVMVAIVLISVVPMGLEWMAARRRAARSAGDVLADRDDSRTHEAEL